MARSMQPDETAQALDRMRHAQRLLTELRPWLAKRQESILVQLVQGYRANTLTDGQIRGAIGAMAELRGLVSELERDIRLGEQASEKLHGNTARRED